MSRLSIFQFLGGASSKRLGTAIENHDMETMRKCLESGVRTIDHMVYRDGDHHGEKYPAGRFDEPMKLARYVGMRPDGMRLLADYGLADAEYQQAMPAAPRLSR
jgi:hypothetical protein